MTDEELRRQQHLQRVDSVKRSMQSARDALVEAVITLRLDNSPRLAEIVEHAARAITAAETSLAIELRCYPERW